MRFPLREDDISGSIPPRIKIRGILETVMTKIRVFLLTLGFLIVGFLGYFLILYARGYHLNLKTWKFQPKGILVIKTEPTGAQIFINADLKGASDSNFSLSPGVYDVDIKKEGFLPWSKRLTITKEIVTEASLSLFKSTPAFSPITFSGANFPVSSADLSKIAFSVLPAAGVEKDKIGLWVMDTSSLPLGFSRDPKRITDGDLTVATYQFSPSAREILLETGGGAFLLDTGNFIPQNQRVNIASQKITLLASWEKERTNKLEAQIKNLPKEFQEFLRRKTYSFSFSPDETKVFYTASASGNLSEKLIPPLPGSSTQKEERATTIDRTYVYDIKEDRNFLIEENGISPDRKLFWLLNSKNLVLADSDKIIIMDYDGTNRQTIYSGSYLAPHVFPFINSSKLLILTSLGSASTPNLYSLNLK